MPVSCKDIRSCPQKKEPPAQLFLPLLKQKNVIFRFEEQFRNGFSAQTDAGTLGKTW